MKIKWVKIKGEGGGILKEEYIKIFSDVLKIKTENGNEKEVALYLKDLLSKHNIESTLLEFAAGRANLVAEISNGEGKTIGISGHMDVVSAGDESKWTHNPYEADIENGVIWGRGTSDMKSGLVALTLAFIELAESKNFKGKIRLMATVGEEVGELGSKQLTDLGYADDLDAILVGEPCNVGVMYAHKGSLNYKLKATGIAAHSSTPELGKNAIENLLDVILLIRTEIEKQSKEYKNEILGETLHNVTLFNGGTQVNSIPDYAEAEVNMRTIPEFSNDKIIELIEDIVDKCNSQGKSLELEVTANQLPVQSNPNSELIKTIIEQAGKINTLSVEYLIKQMGEVMNEDLTKLPFFKEGKIELRPITASGTTDVAQFIRGNKNMEVAVYGPGMPMLNHKIDERLPIEQFIDFIEVYKNILSSYLN